MNRLFLSISIIFLLFTIIHADDNKFLPMNYPIGSVGTKPYFIWYDIYNERDKSYKVLYKLSIKSNDGNEHTHVFSPLSFKDEFYYFKYPVDITPGKYSYKIERLLDNKPVKSKYYHAKKYPVNGSFRVKNDYNKLDRLTPEILIQYLSEKQKNKLINGYNTFFFSAASAGSFGIGMIFLTVLDFGIISKVIAGIAFTASAIGAGASVYYAYQYFETKDNLNKILEQENNVFDNVTRYNVICKFNLKF